MAIRNFLRKSLQKRFLRKSGKGAFPADSRKRLSCVEALESRLLLSAYWGIDGSVLARPVGVDVDGSYLRPGGVAVYLDANDNDTLDFWETCTVTDSAGCFRFDDLAPGEYHVRITENGDPLGNTVPYEVIGEPEFTVILPGIPENPFVDFLIEIHWQSEIDVFMLGDDTGSFQDPDLHFFGLMPDIIDNLTNSGMPVDWGFGIGRFEDYNSQANNGQWTFTNEDRNFVLNQPILSTEHTNFTESINGARTRISPGGGSGLVSLFDALYQVATGAGYDGDGDGDKLGNGPAGPYTSQTTVQNPPGYYSGDIPPFSSFTEEPANHM